LAVQLIGGVFPYDIIFICKFRIIGFLFVVSGVFIAEEVDEEKRGQEVPQIIGLKAFFNMSQRSACFIDEAFLW
jgi:hypothetical protein